MSSDGFVGGIIGAVIAGLIVAFVMQKYASGASSQQHLPPSPTVDGAAPLSLPRQAAPYSSATTPQTEAAYNQQDVQFAPACGPGENRGGQGVITLI